MIYMIINKEKKKKDILLIDLINLSSKTITEIITKTKPIKNISQFLNIQHSIKKIIINQKNQTEKYLLVHLIKDPKKLNNKIITNTNNSIIN